MSDHVAKIQEQWRTERPELDVSPQGIVGRLHRLALFLTKEIVAVYQDFGLSEGEFDILCALRRAGAPYGLRPADIAQTTMVTTGGTTKRIDRLEKMGLIERMPSQKDGRGKVVCLTDSGLDLIDRAFEAHLLNEHRLVAMLSPGERQDLERILRGWLGNFE